MVGSKFEHNWFNKIEKLNEYLAHFDEEFINKSFNKAVEIKKNILYNIFGYILDSLNDIETN